MNNRRFDDLARTVAAVVEGRASRRAVLRALGLGGAAAVAGYSGAGPHTDAAKAQRGATPPPVPANPVRLPGGTTVEQKAFDLQFDIDRIFRFVADEIDYDAYGGALRGVKGTLWGLAGNSVDQALLLAALLDQALVPVRFAIGELDDAGASQLLDAMRFDDATARERASRVLTPGQSGTTTEAEAASPTPEQEAAFAWLAERAEAVVAFARGQLAAGVQTIESALADARITLPPAESVLPDRERRQHVWVQYADGSLWVDLDPTVPNAQAGRTYATVLETVDQLPDELYHGVTFRLTAEVVRGGQAVREELLTHHLRSQDLVGIPVILAHTEPEALEAVGWAIVTAISGMKTYLPHLLVGEDVIYGTPIGFTTEGMLDILGTGSTSEGETLGEWLEVEVLVPDAPPRRIVREIFDRVSTDQRLTGKINLATIPPVVLTEVPEIGPYYLPLLALSTLAVVGGRMPFDYFQQDFDISDDLADLATVSHGYYHVRDVLELQLVTDHRHRFYYDQPNIIAFNMLPGTIGGTDASFELDLLHRSFGTAPPTGDLSPFHPGIVAGVLSHTAERTVFESGAVLEADPPPGMMRSVGRLFQEAELDGIPIRVISPDDPIVEDLMVSDRAKRLISEVLMDGYLVIVPERAIPLDGELLSGWWQVDPRTGATLDQMEDGKGDVLVSAGRLWKNAVAAFFHYQRLGVVACGLYIMAAGMLAITIFSGGSLERGGAASALAAGLGKLTEPGKIPDGGICAGV